MNFVDHLGRTVTLRSSEPRRIVSLCPSQTETLFELGLEDRVVGVTRYCVHPPGPVAIKEKVGGTKRIDFDRVERLNPDLIICEKEENTPEMVAALEARYPVYVTDVRDYSSALRMIQSLGELTSKQGGAKDLIREIESRFAGLVPPARRKRVAYLIWRKPTMAVGSDTYIDSLLSLAGMENVFAADARYPEISHERLRSACPDEILLSSEPYPFKEVHAQEFREICPEAKVRQVNGELFSWYGSRMLQFPEYVRGLNS